MKSITSPLSPASYFLSLACLTVGISTSHAGGLRTVNLPAIPPASTTIQMDGNLSDWSSPLTRYQPLILDPALPADEQLEKIAAETPAVEIGMTYNSDALYVALRFQGASKEGNPTSITEAGSWALKGDGIELHLIGNQKLDIACWPTKGDVVARTRIDGGEWAAAQTLGITTGFQRTKEGFDLEIRIPWNPLTNSDAIMRKPIQWAVDLGWASLSPDKLRTLPLELRIPNLHTTKNFLTSRSKLFSDSYIPSSNDWGSLEFSAEAAMPKIEKSESGSTGITSLSVGPGSPKIDGSIGDWPVLAPLHTDSKLLGDSRYSGAFGAQYDNTYFYFAAKLSTTQPVTNPTYAASNFSGFGFRGGDCLQIRLATPQGAKASLCAWLDTSSGTPQLYIDNATHGPKRADLLTLGAHIAISPVTDGSYVIEGAIPWTAMLPASAPPKAGDVWSATFQPWWAGLEPTFTISGQALHLETRGALAFNYDMPADGQVSIGVYEKSGKLLRWLTEASFRRKGANTEYWDGLDQFKNPIPAGDYLVKALHYPGITLDYKLTLGNPGNPGWVTPDGKGDWLSDEGTPQGVATDGDWTFLASPYYEKAFSVIAVDATGQKQWGAQHSAYGRSAALAVSGDYLYVLYSGPNSTDSTRIYDPRRKNAVSGAYVVCMDKRTGLPAKFSRATPYLQVAAWPYREEYSFLWDLRRDHNYTPANYGGQPRYVCHDVGESTNALGIAATPGRIFVGLFYDNKILELDAETGQQIREFSVPAPVSLHAPNENTLLAVSRESVVSFDLTQPTPEPVAIITKNLEAPFGLTTDKKGQIYVSDWKTSFQVKVFSSRGKLLRSIGEPGGRPYVGAWDNNGMLVPRGIAVTDAGKLWVAEDDSVPKRVSVWDSKSGKFLKDYIGPTPYGGGGLFWMDPKDDTIAYVMGTRVKIDYATKTTRTLATVIRKMDRAQPFMPNGHTSMSLARSFYHEGFTYMVSTSRQGVVLLKETDGIYIPVAAAGHLLNEGILKDGTEMRVWDSAIGSHYYPNYYPDFFRGRQSSNYSWSDVNGDGLVQAEEMRWEAYLGMGQQYIEGRQPQWNTYWGATMALDGSIYFGTMCQNRRMVMRLAPLSWDERGVPLFDISTARPVVTSEGRKSAVSGLYASSDNRLYAANKYEFYNGETNPYAFETFDLEGKPLWQIAMTSGPKDDAVLAENIVGEFTVPNIGNIVGTWLWHANYRPYLLSDDGLFVASPLKNTKIGPASTWDESFKYYHQSTDGKPYIINGGSAGYHILEIQGLEKGGRFESSITITDADVANAASMRQVPEAVVLPKPVIKVDWSPSGALEARQGVTFKGRSGQTVQAALSRDQARLNLAFEVEDPTPLVNKGSNWQTLFITGDCVDLMLATDAEADANRRNAAPGDLRLLFSLYNGKPVAVLYRPAVPGTQKAIQLMAARIDDIRLLDSASVVFTKTPKGYKLDASVALSDLGLDPESIPNLRGDVGVVFSDDTGNGRSERLYYYNRDTNITADLTTEATLQPAEWGKVVFPLGKNMLQNGGFSSPLRDTDIGAWKISWMRSGTDADVTDDNACSGPTSLILSQVKPVVFSAESFKMSDYLAFKQSANAGNGIGGITVTQRVPVTPGNSYSLRYNYYADGLKEEKKSPGADRGYAAFSVRIEWIGAINAKDKVTGVSGIYGDSANEWKSVYNMNTKNASIPRPYVAPDGAREANIVLQLITCAPDTLPRVNVDDVEFVDITETTVRP